MDPEKKKTIVVGALFVAMLGIGAFQFSKMGGEGGGETPEAKPEETKTTADEKSAGKAKAPKNPMYAMALSARDPFRPAAFSVSQPEEAAPVAPKPVAAAKLDGKPLPMPGGLDGQLPPMGLPPVPGSPTDGPGLPNPAPAPKPRFGGALIGVIVGANSAAVFRLGDSQKIVTVGSEISPGVRLLSVSPRKATVRFHGQTITLNLQDEAPASSPSAARASAPPSLPTSASTPSSLTPSPADTNLSETPNE